jgi:hypothetical protein
MTKIISYCRSLATRAGQPILPFVLTELMMLVPFRVKQDEALCTLEAHMVVADEVDGFADEFPAGRADNIGEIH